MEQPESGVTELFIRCGSCGDEIRLFVFSRSHLFKGGLIIGGIGLACLAPALVLFLLDVTLWVTIPIAILAAFFVGGGVVYLLNAYFDPDFNAVSIVRKPEKQGAVARKRGLPDRLKHVLLVRDFGATSGWKKA